MQVTLFDVKLRPYSVNFTQNYKERTEPTSCLQYIDAENIYSTLIRDLHSFPANRATLESMLRANVTLRAQKGTLTRAK